MAAAQIMRRVLASSSSRRAGFFSSPEAFRNVPFVMEKKKASMARAPAGMSEPQVMRQAWANRTSATRCCVICSGRPRKGQLRVMMEAKKQMNAIKAPAERSPAFFESRLAVSSSVPMPEVRKRVRAPFPVR